MKLPRLRKDLLVQDLNDEVLVYDTNSNKAYCLNSTTRIVFNACDGQTTLEDLKHHLPEDIVFLSLDELRKNNLIQSDFVSPFAGMNRREVIKKVGLTSMVALPVISSLIAPQAINAASNCANSGLPSDQGTCPANLRCVTGTCVPCIPTGQPNVGCVNFSICCDGSCNAGPGLPGICSV